MKCRDRLAGVACCVVIHSWEKPIVFVESCILVLCLEERRREKNEGERRRPEKGEGMQGGRTGKRKEDMREGGSGRGGREKSDNSPFP